MCCCPPDIIVRFACGRDGGETIEGNLLGEVGVVQNVPSGEPRLGRELHGTLEFTGATGTRSIEPVVDKFIRKDLLKLWRVLTIEGDGGFFNPGAGGVTDTAGKPNDSDFTAEGVGTGEKWRYEIPTLRKSDGPGDSRAACGVGPIGLTYPFVKGART